MEIVLKLLWFALIIIAVVAFVVFVVWIAQILVPLLGFPEPVPRLIYVAVGIACLIGVITVCMRYRGKIPPQ